MGDAIGGTAEVILGTAVVVKNGIGDSRRLFCFALCVTPPCPGRRYGPDVPAGGGRPAAGVRQEADRCIAGMADACQLLMRLIFTAGMLFLLTIAIVAVSTNRT